MSGFESTSLIHRKSLAGALLALLCLCSPVLRAQDAPKPHETLQSGFQSRHWVVRAFTALRATRYSDLDSLRVLAERFDNEDNERVRAFLMSALAAQTRENLLLILTGDRIEKIISAVDPRRDPFLSRHAHAILGTAFERSVPESQRKWAGEYKSRGGKLLAERGGLLRSKNLKEEDVAALALPAPRALRENESQDDLDKELMRSVVPDGFGDYLRRLELHGVYMCILLDDTSSMENVIGETRQRIWDILGVMQEITPKYNLAFITYKDRVNRVFPFASDGKAIHEFLRTLKAQGGGDDREGPDKALQQALEDPDLGWDRKAVDIIVVMGDQPPHSEDEAPMLDMAKLAKSKDMTVNTIGTDRTTSGKAIDVDYFIELAEAGGGEYARLDEVTDLLENILLLSFGPEYRDFVKPFVRGMVEMRGIGQND